MPYILNYMHMQEFVRFIVKIYHGMVKIEIRKLAISTAKRGGIEPAGVNINHEQEIILQSCHSNSSFCPLDDYMGNLFHFWYILKTNS